MDISNFLDNSPTKFQAISFLKEEYKKNGFIQVFENKDFNLQLGKKYFLIRSNSALFSFVLPNQISGINFLSCHIDSPCLKLKVETEKEDLGHKIVKTEVYGGLIYQSILNEVLRCGGIVCYKKDGQIFCKNIVLKTKFFIPNLAIHLNRNINKGIEYNEEEHFKAIILDDSKKQNIILSEIAATLNIDISDILSQELFLSTASKSEVINDYIISPKIDNLVSAKAMTEAILQSNSLNKIAFCAYFDYEEVGSMSQEGAFSNFLPSITERILCDLGHEKKQIFKILGNSSMLSLDGAHASHPNYKASFDLDYKNVLGKGLSIKTSPSLNYTQDNELLAKFRLLCQNNNIKHQFIKNPSNIRGGKTLGVLASAFANLPSIDLGIPMHSMHSMQEMAHIKDISELEKASILFLENI